MRHAKIMLSVLSFTVIIAMSFALKINKSIHVIYTGPLHSGVCTIKVTGRVIITGTPQCAASTIAMTSDCPDACITVIDN